MDNKIRGVLVEPGKRARIAEVGNSLEEIYAALGCEMIECCYPFEDLVGIVCDEEGKLNGSKPNRALLGEDGKVCDVVFGSFFVCDVSGEDFGSLSDEMLEKYRKYFDLPERFVSVGGNILPIKYDPDRVG